MNLASQLYEVVRRFPKRPAVTSDSLTIDFAGLGALSLLTMRFGD